MNIQVQQQNKTSYIDAAERKRRKDAIDFARGSCRLEGIILSDEIEALNERFINGELTSEEHTKQGLVRAVNVLGTVKIAEQKSFLRIKELELKLVEGKFDVAHLLEIHRRVFQDSPEHKGGCIRPETDSWQKNRSLENVKLSYPVQYDTGNLHNKMDAVLKPHGGVQGFTGLSIAEFAKKMTDLYVAADYIHPFLEGNSRTLRTFTKKLASEAGFKFDWGASAANAVNRDTLYKARDREVILCKYPNLDEATAMKTQDRREYETYMCTLALIKDGVSLESVIQDNVEILEIS